MVMIPSSVMWLTNIRPPTTARNMLKITIFSIFFKKVNFSKNFAYLWGGSKPTTINYRCWGIFWRLYERILFMQKFFILSQSWHLNFQGQFFGPISTLSFSKEKANVSSQIHCTHMGNIPCKIWSRHVLLLWNWERAKLKNVKNGIFVKNRRFQFLALG